MKSDESLMLGYCEGDQLSFEILYSRYKARVYAYIIKRAPSAAVEDLYQQVFLKLHEKKHLYDPTYPFAPWFFTLCRHTIVDHLRKKSEQPDLWQEWNEDFYETDGSEEAGKDDRELPEMDQASFQLLYLKFVEGRGYKELEQEFNTKPATLRKRVERLLNSLRGESENG